MDLPSYLLRWSNRKTRGTTITAREGDEPQTLPSLTPVDLLIRVFGKVSYPVGFQTKNVGRDHDEVGKEGTRIGPSRIEMKVTNV